MKTVFPFLIICISLYGCNTSDPKEKPNFINSTSKKSLRENPDWFDIVLSEVPIKLLGDSFYLKCGLDSIDYFKLRVQRYNMPDLIIKVYQLNGQFYIDRKVFLEDITPAEEYFEPIKYKDSILHISSADFFELKKIFSSFELDEFSYLHRDDGPCRRGADYTLYVARTFGEGRYLKEWYIPRLTLTPVTKRLINWFTKCAKLEEINEPIIFW